MALRVRVGEGEWMDRDDLKAVARREGELAELTVLGARDRLHEADHAVAARELLAAFDQLVNGRIAAPPRYPA